MGNTVNVIFVHDGFERTIRELKDAIDNLEYDADAVGDRQKYANAVRILTDAVWQEFDVMCGCKAKYTQEEYREMLDKHRKRREKEEVAE